MRVWPRCGLSLSSLRRSKPCPVDCGVGLLLLDLLQERVQLLAQLLLVVRQVGSLLSEKAASSLNYVGLQICVSVV